MQSKTKNQKEKTKEKEARYLKRLELSNFYAPYLNVRDEAAAE